MNESPNGAAAQSQATLSASSSVAPASTACAAAEVVPTTPATRDKPYLALVTENRQLTRDTSSKLTIHTAMDIANSPIFYDSGDACGIVPKNAPSLVDEVLSALHFTGDEAVDLPKAGPSTLRDALTHKLTFTRLSRKLVETYANKGECTKLQALLVPEQQKHLDAYIWGRGVIDLLLEYPGVVREPAELATMLPRLTPRLYSIASSPAAHKSSLELTVAVVRYRSFDRERGGVCSTQLADRAPVGERLPIYIQVNKRFRLPAADVPIIMIGPGTGVAPFRSFLFERRALGAMGRNWLFFGERSAATDFLYREELEEMVSSGHLTRLDTAFSRDQDHKIYVQDRMIEQAPRFWSWLEDGASIYVCGDAQHMAKDVDNALHSIIEKQGGMSPESAKEYVGRLKDEHRYHRDVY